MDVRKRLGALISSQLSIDPRTLAFTRIAMATLLLIDLGKRASVIATWYGNTGLLPNHTFLWQPIRTFHLSFLWMFSHWQEAAFAFVGIALVYLSLLVGYRTRVSQVLALICLISLQVRVDLLSNGGDFVFCALLWWTVFLPLGKRFSIDAILHRFRSAANTPDELLSDRPPRETQQVISLAVLAAMVQLALIYGFNAAHKQGPTWSEGTAIYYLIQQERILTPLGLLAREYMPFIVTQALTYATLVIEAVLPLLILSPWGRPWTRRLAIFLLFGLHINIALISNVGVFSAVMCVFGTLLLTADDWDALAAWGARRRTTRVYYDARSGLSCALARILACMDTLGRFVWHDKRQALELPAEFDAAPMLVFDPETGHYTKDAAAWAEIVRALPLGFAVAWIVRLPGVRQLSTWASSSSSFETMSRFWGLVGFESVEPARAATAAVPIETPVQPTREARWRGRARIGMRESAVAFLIFVATAQVLHENWALPNALKVRQMPTWITACVSYTRLHQGWQMFAPDTPTSENDVVIRAHTVDGRLIDPIRWAAGGSDEVVTDRIVVQPGFDVFWVDYVARIADRGVYHPPLRDWILAHHQRTGNPRDRIRDFEAYRVSQDSPPPGETNPRNFEVRGFMKWPEPASKDR